MIKKQKELKSSFFMQKKHNFAGTFWGYLGTCWYMSLKGKKAYKPLYIKGLDYFISYGNKCLSGTCWYIFLDKECCYINVYSTFILKMYQQIYYKQRGKIK